MRIVLTSSTVWSTWTPRALATAGGVWLALACGGLEVPVPGGAPASEPTATDAATDEGAPAPEPAPPPELPTPVEAPAAAGGDPLSVFPETLDPGEPPPEGTNPTCPPETSIIRYPRPQGMDVYCATTQGMKNGPWYRVVGSRVVEVRQYDAGKQVGRAVRWLRKGSNAPIKIAEETWVDDAQAGPVAEWNDAGLLTLRGQYAAGKRQGKFLMRAPAKPDALDGRCFEADAEKWATTDPAEFVAKPCP